MRDLMSEQSELANQLNAVHRGQVDFNEDDVGPVLPRNIKCLLAVAASATATMPGTVRARRIAARTRAVSEHQTC